MNEVEEKEIEEMAKDIHRVCTACSGEMFDEYTCDRCQAKLLVKKGYRKLPDGATVLLVGKYNQALDEKTIEYFVKHNKQIRKETAREILQPLYDACKDDSYGQVVVDFAILERLAKQYGVEVEE